MVGLVQGMQLMLENHRAACSVGGFPCSQFLLFPSSHSAPHFLLHQGNWLPSSFLAAVWGGQDAGSLQKVRASRVSLKPGPEAFTHRELHLKVILCCLPQPTDTPGKGASWLPRTVPYDI